MPHTNPQASPKSLAALAYAERGWHVFPLHFIASDGACSCRNTVCKSPGKHPMTANGLKAATTDLATIARYWQRWPDANIGIVTGKLSGIVVLDIDGAEGEAILSQLEQQHGALPITLTQTTGKGRHLVFAAPATPLKSRTSIAGMSSKLDSRGEGGYIVAAPSNHYSGKNYVWQDLSAPLATMPTWLTDIINGKQHSAEVTPTVAGMIEEGGRNATLTSLAGTMRRKGMSEQAIAQALLAENGARCIPPLDEAEVLTIAASISRYEAANDPDSLFQSLNDVGNAERFVLACRDTYRYFTSNSRWIVWDGQRWSYDDRNRVVEMAKDVARSIFREAADCRSESGMKELAKHAKKSMQRQGVTAMIELAKSHPDLIITADEIDANPMLLGVANGMIDLRTGVMQPHNPEVVMLRYLPIVYDPNAGCPNFTHFLNIVTNNDSERATYLQRVAGYCLSGSTAEQCLFFLYGKGGNGKSTFAGVLSDLLGEYARQAPSDMLTQRTLGRSQSNDLARLSGARLVISSEVEEGSFLAETLVKELTGGDVIAARFLYGEFFEFRPQFKILMSGNHKPVVRGEDEGIWRRIRLVPFDVTIPAETRDKNLMTKLRAELPGILAWAVRGCLEWQQHGLGTPRIVEEAVAEYRSDMDILGHWLEAGTETGNDYSERSGLLYDAYHRWATANGHRQLSSTAFGRKLSERFEKVRAGGGQFYRGLRIKKMTASGAV